MGKLIGVFMILGIGALMSYLSFFFISNNPLEVKVEPKTEIILTGDVMLGRTVMARTMDLNDAGYPFAEVADELRRADITFINLENPIIENCPRHEGGFIFCADPFMVESLTFAGIDIVTLANNHTLNHGQDGLEQTKKYLTEVGIEYVGTGNLVVREVNGIKFGFLGFNKAQLSQPRLTGEEVNLVKSSNSQVDVLIVGMHWGVEYQSVALDGQEQLANELVNYGADVIVGHHPHWVQNIDHIKGIPVYYSLGNFVFDQMFNDKVRSGLAVKLTFKKENLQKEELMNIYMENWSQPKWVD